MKSDFLIAVTQLAAERNLPKETVISAIEAALISAYKKDNTAAGQSITVRLNPSAGEVRVYQLKTVVEEATDPLSELTQEEARQFPTINPNPQIGDVLEFEIEPQGAGRIAAQTAKQVVIQRLREAERELIYNEFSEKEGEVFTGTVQRGDGRYGGNVTLDLNGRAEAILPPPEQSPYDRYRPGQKMKVLVLEVQRTPRGPEIVVSRTHVDLLRRLFEMEVPEIHNGIVELRAIAREPGSRSKVAVVTRQEGVDPVGACVGLRGIRIQNIVNELQGEKIDVVQWSRDPAIFIAHALSPAQPQRVDLDDEEAQAASVVVPDRQLSLAIGKDGQNVRLAAKLTNWKIDIKGSTALEIEQIKQAIEGQVAEQARAAGTEAPALVKKVVAVEPVAARAPGAGVAEAPEAPEAEPGLSPEEALALQSLEVTAPVASPSQMPPEAQPVEEQEELVDAEEVGKVPEPIGGGPQIRFAEDIMGASEYRGTRKRRGRSRSVRQRGPRPAPRPK